MCYLDASACCAKIQLHLIHWLLRKVGLLWIMKVVVVSFLWNVNRLVTDCVPTRLLASHWSGWKDGSRQLSPHWLNASLIGEKTLASIALVPSPEFEELSAHIVSHITQKAPQGIGHFQGKAWTMNRRDSFGYIIMCIAQFSFLVCDCSITMQWSQTENTSDIRFWILTHNMGWFVKGAPGCGSDVKFIIYLWDVKIFPLISRRVLNNLSSLDKYYHYTPPWHLRQKTQQKLIIQEKWT